jgi:hypothetical protein
MSWSRSVQESRRMSGLMLAWSQERVRLALRSTRDSMACKMESNSPGVDKEAIEQNVKRKRKPGKESRSEGREGQVADIAHHLRYSYYIFRYKEHVQGYESVRCAMCDATIRECTIQ